MATDRLDDMIREHVIAVLSRCNFNRSEAARRLGVHRQTLQRWLRGWDL